MILHINKNASTPISRQIIDQVRAQCLAGILKPGTRIESVREMARQLAINPNTVLRVYEKLTAEGLLDRRHGAGTFIAEHPANAQLDQQRERFTQEVNRLAQQGRMLGLDADAIRIMVDHAIAVSFQAPALPSPESSA